MKKCLLIGLCLSSLIGSLEALPQAQLIPLGYIEVVFDAPVGSERWDSFKFDVSFHTATGGWCSGQAQATVFPPVPGGSDPIIYSKLVPFTYTP